MAQKVFVGSGDHGLFFVQSLPPPPRFQVGRLLGSEVGQPTGEEEGLESWNEAFPCFGEGG